MRIDPTQQKKIDEEFERARKEYAAHDRTLCALAALHFVVTEVEEIRDESETTDFRPRLCPIAEDVKPYTPDGLLTFKPDVCFVLELKTQWNDKDPKQVIKYGRSQARILVDGSTVALGANRCVLLGYQNVPGEENLNRLFAEWEAAKIPHPLVVFRYAIEQGADGDRMYIARVAYDKNGLSPKSSFGKALNNPRGFPVSVDNYKRHRSRFHRANDSAIPSYAAVLWWNDYANEYLSEEQKIEMAEKGRLSSPLVIRSSEIDAVPCPKGVDAPLSGDDVRLGLSFLHQAGIVALKKRKNSYEVVLKEDRHFRVPRLGPSGIGSQVTDLSTKILARWATGKILNPVRTARPNRRRGTKPSSRRNASQRRLFE